MKNVIVSWTLLLVCNIMWALQFTCIKLTQEQVGPYFTVWGPMLLATIFLIPLVRQDFKKGKKVFKDLLVFAPLALLGAFPAQVLDLGNTIFTGQQCSHPGTYITGYY